MKTIVSLVIAAMMLLGMTGTALAYDAEITFQGIPWGSTNEEAAKNLLENGFFLLDDDSQLQMDEEEFLQYAMYLSRSAPYYLIEEKGSIRVGSSPDFEKVGYEIYVNNPFGKIKTIGGYSFTPIMYFAGNGEDAALIAVSMSAGPGIDDKAMFGDLEQKLTSVYGDKITGDAETITGKKTSYDAWLGSNNTCVRLFNNSGMIQLIYGTLDAESILNEYLSAAPTEKPADSTDVGGL